MAGLPWVAMSPWPGRPPPTFRGSAGSRGRAWRSPGIRARRPRARVHADARAHGPPVHDHERRHRVRGGLDAVEVEGRARAWPRAAATMTGNTSGPQPAITALIATFSTVASRQSGGIFPTDWSARRRPRRASRARAPRSAARTEARRVHPCARNCASTASRESGSSSASDRADAHDALPPRRRPRAMAARAGPPPARSGGSTPSGGLTARADDRRRGAAGPVHAEAVRLPQGQRGKAVVDQSRGRAGPRSSSESWRLHDVQEPQSAEPVEDEVDSFASRRMISWRRRVDALAFRCIRRRRRRLAPGGAPPMRRTRRSKLPWCCRGSRVASRRACPGGAKTRSG